MLLMRIMAETPCPRRMPQGENVNMVSNPHFEGLDSGRKMGQLAAAKDWGNFGKGFEVRPLGQTRAVRSGGGGLHYVYPVMRWDAKP